MVTSFNDYLVRFWNMSEKEYKTLSVETRRTIHERFDIYVMTREQMEVK